MSFFVFFIFSFKASQSVCNYTAATGSSFTVLLEHVLKDNQKLKWRLNKDIIFRLSAVDKNFGSNGSLKLTNLNKTNEGTYTPEVHDANGRSLGPFKSTTLCVLGR